MINEFGIGLITWSIDGSASWGDESQLRERDRVVEPINPSSDLGKAIECGHFLKCLCEIEMIRNLVPRVHKRRRSVVVNDEIKVTPHKGMNIPRHDSGSF